MLLCSDHYYLRRGTSKGYLDLLNFDNRSWKYSDSIVDFHCVDTALNLRRDLTGSFTITLCCLKLRSLTIDEEAIENYLYLKK